MNNNENKQKEISKKLDTLLHQLKERGKESTDFFKKKKLIEKVVYKK